MNKVDILVSKACCRRNVTYSKEGLPPSVMLFSQKYFTLLRLTAVKASHKVISVVIASRNASGFRTPLLHVSLPVDLMCTSEVR